MTADLPTDDPGGWFGHGAGALSHAAGLVGDARGDLEHIATRLDDQLAALTGQWSGQGARAFATLHDAWAARHRVIIAALDDLASSLAATERDDIVTDDDQHAQLTRLARRVG